MKRKAFGSVMERHMFRFPSGGPRKWVHRSKPHDFENCDMMINRPVEQDHHRKGTDQTMYIPKPTNLQFELGLHEKGAKTKPIYLLINVRSGKHTGNTFTI